MEIANKENGTQLLMKMSLEALMKSERSLHQSEFPEDYANGYRLRRVAGYRKEMALQVPRTRSGAFYPCIIERSS